ncbi:hypothetical protein HPB47_016170, partial [Ixodes persulcatus]
MRHTFSLVYHPQGNEQIERFNYAFKDYVQAQVRSQQSCCVDAIQGQTWTSWGPSKDFFDQPTKSLGELRQSVTQYQQRTKKYTDAHRGARVSVLTPGDKVRVKLPDTFEK